MDESTKEEIRRLKRRKEMAEQDYKRDEKFSLEQLKAISKFALQCVLELVILLIALISLFSSAGRKLDNQIMKLEGVEPNGRASGGKVLQKIDKDNSGEGRKKRRLKLNRSNAEYNKVAAEELANKENDNKMADLPGSKMPPQPVVKPSKLKSKKSKNNNSPSNEEKAASKVAKEQQDAVRNKWCLDMRNKQQAWVAQREEENHQLLESFNNDVSSIEVKLYEIDLNDEDERDKLADELYALEKRIEKECFLLDISHLKSKCRSIRECAGFTQAAAAAASAKSSSAAVAASVKSSSAATKKKAPNQGKKKRPAKNDFDFDSPVKKGSRQVKKKGGGQKTTKKDKKVPIKKSQPKRKHTYTSDKTRQSHVANANRMTQATHDARRDGNNHMQALHAMCTESSVKIPGSDLCNKDVAKFRRNGKGIAVTHKRLLPEVGKTMAIAAGHECLTLRRYKFTLKTEVIDDEGRKGLKTYQGDPRSLADDTKLYFDHDNFRIDTPSSVLAAMKLDMTIGASKLDVNTLVFGPAGCNLPTNSDSIRECREETCTACRQAGCFDCCINCGKEFKKRYTNEAGWKAAREADGLPIIVDVSCPNKDKGCDWFCQSNEKAKYGIHIGRYCKFIDS